MNFINNGARLASLITAVLSLGAFASTEVESSIAKQTQATNSLAVTAVSNKESKAHKLQLMAKLAKLKFFSADFTQTIFDENGTELQQGSGQLSVNKPNLVNWHTNSPDESVIISDGKDLWFFDPFVEQVSVYALQNAIANTPILLLTSDDPSLWQHYSVSLINDDTFLVHANDENARVKTLELSFSPKAVSSQLVGFNILDATGQLSVIKLSNSNTDDVPSASLFKFDIPQGVYIDDQR
jgi:outer membrane lipoprotein carrier protein